MQTVRNYFDACSGGNVSKVDAVKLAGDHFDEVSIERRSAPTVAAELRSGFLTGLVHWPRVYEVHCLVQRTGARQRTLC